MCVSVWHVRVCVYVCVYVCVCAVASILLIRRLNSCLVCLWIMVYA